MAAEYELESLFDNSITISVQFFEQNQGKNGIALSNSADSYRGVSYSDLTTALQNVAPSDVLPASSPAPSGTDFYIPEAYARMLGLSFSEPTYDDTVTLNSYYPKQFGQDVINGLIHEISENGMGRVGGLGANGNGQWSTMDLFRYTSSGVADYSDGKDGQTTYFSSDGGAIVADQNQPDKGAPSMSYNNQYNSTGKQVNTGDTADWSQTQVFGATADAETLALTQTELDVMEALGWHLTLHDDVDNVSGDWETATNWSPWLHADRSPGRLHRRRQRDGERDARRQRHSAIASPPAPTLSSPSATRRL